VTRVSALSAVAVGLGLGLVCGFYRTGAIVTLGSWGVAGIAIGAWLGHWHGGAACGALFGFTASLCFLLAGYGGAGPVTGALPFFLLLSVVGAICGAVLGGGGAMVRTRLARP